MRQIAMPEPNERQKAFLTDHHKYIAYGGARGGGKSWAVRWKAILLCLRYAGITCMIVRKTYPELYANHIRPLIGLLNCRARSHRDRFAQYNDQRKEIRFANGSLILFRYCDHEKDADAFQGTEVDVLFVDEATQQSESKMEKLAACVRGVNDFPKRVYYTCNPGGEGHAWVKRLFVDRQYRQDEDPEEYAFIRASVFDNKALMKAQPDYVKQLERLPPKLKEAWLYGNWDIFEGQFFEELRLTPDLQAAQDAGCRQSAEELLQQRKWTHVIAPFDVSAGACRGWNIVRSYDFGYAKPFSCAWWAIDYDGVMYRILELYGCTQVPNEGVKWTPDEQFRKIAEIERTHPWLKGRKITGVADPAIWDASRGESVADTAMRYGIYFTPGDHARLAGWMQCHYRLQFDENGYARCYIFDTCKAFIRTIPGLLYSQTVPEDIDTSLEDHVADEWRYLCMSRPVKPMRPAQVQMIINDPLDQFTNRR